MRQKNALYLCPLVMEQTTHKQIKETFIEVHVDIGLLRVLSLNFFLFRPLILCVLDTKTSLLSHFIPNFRALLFPIPTNKVIINIALQPR